MTNEDRADELLRGVLSMLNKADRSFYVIDPMEGHYEYDETTCDGHCLRQDIMDYLGVDDE